MNRSVFSSSASTAAASASVRGDEESVDNDAESNSNDNVLPEGGDAPPMNPTMVCTCAVELGPKICFATYDEDSNEITIEESACSGQDFAVVTERYFALMRPNLLLVGNSIVSNEQFLETLTKPLPDPSDDDNDNSSQQNGSRGRHPNAASIPYRVLKSRSFDSRNCMSLIMAKLRVLSLLKNVQNNDAGNLAMNDPSRIFPSTRVHRSFSISNYHMYGSVIDFDSQLQIKAVGALLSFLQSTIFKLESNGTVTVANVVHSRSSMYMSINASTIAALQIFATEHHPLMASKGRGNSKEGSSVFSLLDRTQSRGGRQMLRNWMLKPLKDRNEILLRQDGVELFLSPMLDCESSVGAMITSLGEVGPINQILSRMKKCTVLPMDFVILVRTLLAANEICNIIQCDLLERLRDIAATQQQVAAMIPAHGAAINNNNNNNNKAARYMVFLERILHRCNTEVLADLHDRICNIVDVDSTYEARDTVCIRTGYHEQLDQFKEQLSTLNERLYVIRNQTMQKYPELGELVVVFIPQVGFLVGIEKKRALRLRLPPDFDHCFDNEDGHAYFKNTDMNELDQEPGDLDGHIKDLESKIVYDLEEDILDQEPELRDTFLALSELDCIISFAITAKDRNYIRPRVVEPQEDSNVVVKIRNGRHPLQEILVEGNFVANNIDIDNDKRVNVVTGPNFSGKSCYARQVGALVYMAQIGSFLPCEAAHISIVDQIFAQFSSVETCAVPQSSFQLDLTHMGTILRRSTPRTLVLIDEFGKGTNPASGIALLTAALKKFSCTSVAVVCTTHFLEIFSRQLLVDGQNGIKTLRMAVHVPNDEEDIAEPLFRLEDGVADSSAGIICAKMAGLSTPVVQRAKEIVLALKEGKQLEPNPSVIISPAAKEVLKSFLSVESWQHASDSQVQRLLQKIAKL